MTLGIPPETEAEGADRASRNEALPPGVIPIPDVAGIVGAARDAMNGLANAGFIDGRGSVTQAGFDWMKGQNAARKKVEYPL